MAVFGHCPIADGASGAAIGGPIGGEQAKRETPRTGITHSKRICPRGAGAAHDFDGGQPSSEEPIQIGGKPIVIGERARTSNDETKHTNTPMIQVGGEPPQSGGRRQLDRGLNAKGTHSQGREAPKGTLDGGGLLCFRHPFPFPVRNQAKPTDPGERRSGRARGAARAEEAPRRRSGTSGGNGRPRSVSGDAR